MPFQQNFTVPIALMQHKDFDEIEGRLRRREPLFVESLTVQKLTRQISVEVVSDPVNDVDNDPYEDGTDMQRQLNNHQVYFVTVCKIWLGSSLWVKDDIYC